MVEQASSAVVFLWEGLKDGFLANPCLNDEGIISSLMLVPLDPKAGPAHWLYSALEYIIVSDPEAGAYKVLPRMPVAPNPKLQDLTAPFL